MSGIRHVLDKAADRGERLAAVAVCRPWYAVTFWCADVAVSVALIAAARRWRRP